jgi:hypothetical protein
MVGGCQPLGTHLPLAQPAPAEVIFEPPFDLFQVQTLINTRPGLPLPLQMSSVSETLSTLNFGKGVTEITLGAAKKNAESGAVFEAKERAMKSERDAAGGWAAV